MVFVSCQLYLALFTVNSGSFSIFFHRSACSWISQFIFLKILEFSGLHYCLFVKDQCFFVAVVLSGNSDILSRPLSFVNNFFKKLFCLEKLSFFATFDILSYLVGICQQLFQKLFKSYGSCFVVLALPQQRNWVYHPIFHLSTLFFIFFKKYLQ